MSIPHATYVLSTTMSLSIAQYNTRNFLVLLLFDKHKKDLCANKGLGMAHPNGFVASKVSVIVIGIKPKGEVGI